MPRRLSDTMWVLRNAGLTPDRTAEILGVGKRQIYRWEVEEAAPDIDTRERIETLGYMVDILRLVYTDDQIASWLLRPNEHLGDKAPWRLLQNSKFDAVLRAAKKATPLPVQDGVSA